MRYATAFKDDIKDGVVEMLWNDYETMDQAVEEMVRHNKGEGKHRLGELVVVEASDEAPWGFEDDWIVVAHTNRWLALKDRLRSFFRRKNKASWSS